MLTRITYRANRANGIIKQMVSRLGRSRGFARRRGVFTPALLVAVVFASLVAVWTAPVAGAAGLPPGFQDSMVLSGLVAPTAVRFSPDGRVFVAEKRGVVKVFDSLTDTTPEVFADLRTNVHNYADRGLLGLALDPGFPAKPYVYVLYTFDHVLGSAAAPPRWGAPGVDSDPCPNPLGGPAQCVVSGRLSRLTAAGNTVTGPEKVLVEDWCQQYSSHSVGALAFGADGALYASGGDGASFSFADYGQVGNPCGDPGGLVGGILVPPTAEGGALRSQDLRTAGDPVGLNGSVIRVDPATGAGLPDNPFAARGSVDANARRVVAYGMRNPFRMAVRPGTSQIWVGDVGWNLYEELNRIDDPADGIVENFGWPCYEGVGAQPAYRAATLNICRDLYAQPAAVTAPVFAYKHGVPVAPGESCGAGGSSISGVAFGPSAGGSYPAEYAGALYFADFPRHCIWAMLRGGDGDPDPTRVRTVVDGGVNPVDLQIGPGGDLFYVDIYGSVHRIRYFPANQPPIAAATASPPSGLTPLTVSFDGRGSRDPDPGDTLTYAWDLDGDGNFDNGTTPTVRYTYTRAGTYTAVLRVTDSRGASDTARVVVTAGNTPPTVTMTTTTGRWKVGDVITFSARGVDLQDGVLPASAYSWELVLQHCPAACHEHPLQGFAGITTGSFTTPDHEYPAYLELRVTVRDSGGLTATRSVRLDPRTVTLTVKSDPSKLPLAINGTVGQSKLTTTVIAGSTNTISAPPEQIKKQKTYRFSSWSDGGAQTHTIRAGTNDMKFKVSYSKTK